MIPDFKELREDLEGEAHLYIQLKRTSSPILSQVTNFTQHEGEKHTYEQVGRGLRDGSFTEVSQEVNFTEQEMISLVEAPLRTKLDEIADGISRQLVEKMLQTIGRECDAVGNSINAGGKPFSKELFLDMIERTEANFDENRRPTQTLILHPELAKSLVPRAKEWDSDPLFVKKHSEIMATKFEEFRERESRRKLVD